MDPFLQQIVPGQDNSVAIELISTHIRRQLKERTHHFRKKMAAKLQPSISRGPRKQLSDEELGLIVLDQTHQLKVCTMLSGLMSPVECLVNLFY